MPQLNGFTEILNGRYRDREDRPGGVGCLRYLASLEPPVRPYR